MNLHTRKEILDILTTPPSKRQELYSKADTVRKENMGDEIPLRGIIEFTNICSSNCTYCGIRASNSKVARYKINDEEILEITRQMPKWQQYTVVLQSGEADSKSENLRIGNLIKQIKALFPACGLWLPTNGSMLLKTKDSVFELIKEVGAHIVVSRKQHCQNFRKEYNWQKVLEGIKRLQTLGISHSVQHSSWRRLWNSPDGYEKPIPFNCNPEKANKVCGYEKCALFLHNGKAYNCCFLGVVHESVEMGVLDKDAWAFAMEYIPLTVDATDDEIMDACATKLLPQCKMCPDFWEAF